MKLSIIVPYFKKYDLFSYAVKCNLKYFSREDYEVIISMDEDSEQKKIETLIKRYPQVRWRVIVNHNEHDWRPPCKAINVGIKHAEGEACLIISPETIFISDVPTVLLYQMSKKANSCVVGELVFGLIDKLQQAKTIEAAFYEAKAKMPSQLFYGCFMFRKTDLEEITGYDEGGKVWGHDHDNTLARLKMNGVSLVKVPETYVMHLAHEERELKSHLLTPEQVRAIVLPDKIRVNETWGEEYNDVIYDWRNENGN